MKRYLLAIVIVAVLGSGWGCLGTSRDASGPSISGDGVFADAFRDRQSGIQVTGEGVVTKILPDDTQGDRHQRFIVQLASGQTLLVAHNVDIAPRLEALEQGDTIEFRGVYEWNSEGGLVHWTHHDPDGQHQGGWLRYDGETFQ